MLACGAEERIRLSLFLTLEATGVLEHLAWEHASRVPLFHHP